MTDTFSTIVKYMSLIVNLSPIKILYVPSANGISGGEEAFFKLESKLPTMKGKKFYGLVFGSPPNETYWACVARNDSDKIVPGCKFGIIPGGKYVQKRVNNWEKNVTLIGETFSKLIHDNNVDSDRPCVEFYHGMNYMIARVPMLG